MNKQYRLIVIPIITVIVVGLAYLLFTRPTAAPSAPPTTQDQQTSTQAQTSPPPERGTYTEYSDSKVASTKDIKLLFFHASWCPQCRALEASIDTTGVPEGVTIFKVDYDSSQKLRQKYGVTLQTTVVKIDDEGNKVDSFIAYDDPSLEAVKQALLQ